MSAQEQKLTDLTARRQEMDRIYNLPGTQSHEEAVRSILVQNGILRVQEAGSPADTEALVVHLTAAVQEWIAVQMEFGAGGDLKDTIRRALRTFNRPRT
jgi:hypothetical protein